MASAFQNAGSDSLTGVVFISPGPAELTKAVLRVEEFG
jgi:hypothetical protein